MLPLVAGIPPAVTASYKKSTAKFYKDFFEAMWQGLGPCRSEPPRHAVVLSAVAECSTFVLLTEREEAGGNQAAVAADVVATYLDRALGELMHHDLAPNHERAEQAWVSAVVKSFASGLRKFFQILRSNPAKEDVSSPSPSSRLVFHCSVPLETSILNSLLAHLDLERDSNDSTRSSSETGLGRAGTLLAAVLPDGWEVAAGLFQAATVRCRTLSTLLAAEPSAVSELARLLRFLVVVQPELQAAAKTDPAAAELAVISPGEALKWLGADASADVEILSLARMAVDDAFRLSWEDGLACWRDVLVSMSHLEHAVFARVIQAVSPDPCELFQRFHQLLSSSELDQLAVEAPVAAAGSGTDEFVRACLGGGYQDQHLEPPWPLVGQDAFEYMLRGCLDAHDQASMQRLGRLLPCVKTYPTGLRPNIPYAAQALAPLFVRLLAKIHRWRIASGEGGGLWVSYATDLGCHGAFDSLARELLGAVTPDLRAFLLEAAPYHAGGVALTPRTWAEQVEALVGFVRLGAAALKSSPSGR